MSEKTELEIVRQILEKMSRKTREEAERRILEDAPKNLQAPLQYLAEQWYEPIRPALMALSCEAVGGEIDSTIPAAVAMTLLCASMNVYDHIMDRTKTKKFVQTLPGSFGDGVSLIVGGLVTAKAFFALTELRKTIPNKRYIVVNRAFQRFLHRMAETEVENLKLRHQADRVGVRSCFRILRMQACDMEACMRIGALIGYGSREEVESLGRYGLYLGTVVRLGEEMLDALNLTAVLADKIKSRSLPFPLMWAISRSKEARKLLSSLYEKERVDEDNIKKVVETMFETGAVEHIRELSKGSIERTVEALHRIKESKAKKKLELIARAQRPVFYEDLTP